MESLNAPQFWESWIRIVLIDLALAGDNAVVIALAVRALPARQQLLGRIFGACGAIVLRIGLIFLVTILLRIPYLKLVAGLLLLSIALKLAQPDHGSSEKVRRGASLGEAIGIIMVADLVMSLDNVLAIAAAAHGDMILAAFGLALSLPLIVWGSSLLSLVMNRVPLVVWLGGGVLGFVAMDMIFQEEFVAGWIAGAPPFLPRLASYTAGAIITVIGWQLSRSAARLREAKSPV